MYQLATTLENETLLIGYFPLSEVRLMQDARYPWVILIPRREGIIELFDLTEPDQRQLQRESLFVAQQMKIAFSAKKMNIANLGNIVTQLHLHHIARFVDDESWPLPVWGRGERQPYPATEIAKRQDEYQQLFHTLLQADDN